MKKALSILILLLLGGCSSRPFRLGGTELKSTMPTQILYLEYGEEWTLTLRYYEALTENEADETTLTVTEKSVAKCFEKAEAVAGKQVLLLQMCSVAVNEKGLEQKDELAYFCGSDTYLYVAGENVAKAEKEDAAAQWHDVLQKEKPTVSVKAYLQGGKSLPRLYTVDGRIALKIGE